MNIDITGALFLLSLSKLGTEFGVERKGHVNVPGGTPIIICHMILYERYDIKKPIKRTN